MSTPVHTTNKEKSRSFGVKEFKFRNSALTDRLENSEDVKTIYNLFAIILISLLTNTVINDLLKRDPGFHFGFKLILHGFGKLYLVALIWGTLNILAVTVFLALKIWAAIRTLLNPKCYARWDTSWLCTIIIYYICVLYGIQKVVRVFQLPPGSAAVILLEGVRLLMKQHSFARSVAPRVLAFKPHSEKILILPSVSQFVYFLFAPTFIFRDEYPRTQKIRWKFVLRNVLEVFGIIFLLALVVERFLVPQFEEFGLRKFHWREIIIPVVGNSFPGIMFMLGGFYSVLHATQNAFAEVLTFGDRMFYREWWTSRSLSEYYRTWNVVVHDWLYTYIYKDMYEIILPKNKMAAKLTVFIVSAIVHEWIVSNTLGLFLPIQFTQFFIASAVLSLLNIMDLPIGNLVVWFGLVVGSGMQVNLYALEFFAHQNCPAETRSSQGFLSSVVPRFLTCNSIE